MLARKSMVLAAAALAATPLVGKAATITFTYDQADFSYSLDGGATVVPVPIGGTAAAPSITVPVGAVVSIGADVAVTNNPNPISGGVYDNSRSANLKQPTVLGIGSFNFGVTNSNATVSAISDPTTITVDNPPFAVIAQGGFTDNAGGILTSSLTGIQNTQGDNSSTAGGIAAIGYGGGSAAEIFNTLNINGIKAGTSVYTPTLAPGAVTYNSYLSGGTTTTVRPVYANTTAVNGAPDTNGVVDTINNLAPLTVVFGSATPTPTPTPTVISLTTAAPATGFGAQVATLTVTGKSGSYNVSSSTPFAATGAGYVAVTGFNPASDTEIYALRVLDAGAAPSATELNTIIGDINAAGGTTGNDGAIVASAVTGQFATAFPGADILLTTSGTNTGNPFLGFNVASLNGTTGIAGTLTVASVAAVPEPASVAALAIGAAGLLIGRRKRA